MESVYALHTKIESKLDVMVVHNPPFAYKVKGTWTGLDVDLVEMFAKTIGLGLRYTESTNFFSAVLGRRKFAHVNAYHRPGYSTHDLVIGGMVRRDWDRQDTGMEASVPYVVGESLMYAHVAKSRTPRQHVTLVETSLFRYLPDHLLNGERYFSNSKPPKEPPHTFVAGALTVHALFGDRIGNVRINKAQKGFDRVILCRVMSGLVAGLSAFIESAVHDGTVAKLLRKHLDPTVKIGAEVTNQPDKGVRTNPGRVITLRKGVLVVAGPTFLPVFDPEAQKGIDVEILRMFAKALHLELNFVKRSTKDLLTGAADTNEVRLQWEGAAHGEEDPRARFYSSFPADIIAGGLSFTHSRERLMSAWTAPYMTARRSVILRKGDGLKDISMAKNDNFLVREASFAWDDALSKGVEYKFLLDDSNLTEEEVFQKLLQGEVRGVLRGNIVARCMVSSFPTLFEFFEWGDDEPLHYLCNAGSGIAATLSAFCKRLELTGVTQRIIESNLTLAKAMKVAPNIPRSRKSQTKSARRS